MDGLYYWLFVNEAGERKPHYGRFTILDRPSQIQYTWMSLHTRGLESIVTVTFQKRGEDTLLTLRHVNLPDDEYGRGHEKGWAYLVSQFADLLGRDRGSPYSRRTRSKLRGESRYETNPPLATETST